MASDRTMRQSLVVAIAQAIREGEGDAEEIAEAAVKQTGLRRAVWGALTARQRKQVVQEAALLARGRDADAERTD